LGAQKASQVSNPLEGGITPKSSSDNPPLKEGFPNLHWEMKELSAILNPKGG
jgi:hypothetical protein